MNLPDNVFRANVGAVIKNSDGLILALERKEIKGAWQMPQGGLDPGEDPSEAVLREIREETCVTGEKLRILSRYPGWLAYELQNPTPKHGRGQVQQWFLLDFTGTDEDIQLDKATEQEFYNYKWVKLSDLAEQVVEFRRPIYRNLVEGFKDYLT